MVPQGDQIIFSKTKQPASGGARTQNLGLYDSKDISFLSAVSVMAPLLNYTTLSLNFLGCKMRITKSASKTGDQREKSEAWL